jgi:hypothetical protein
MGVQVGQCASQCASLFEHKVRIKFDEEMYADNARLSFMPLVCRSHREHSSTGKCKASDK